jgi:murein DD-endopeptidase MepM/ murein hydrolase activator NlpD
MMTQGLPPILHQRPARLAAFSLLALSSIVAAFATMGPDPESVLPAARTVVEPLHMRFADSVLDVPATFVSDERFGRGDTLAALAARLGIGEHDAQRLSRMQALRLLQPGRDVQADVDSAGRLLRLEYQSGRDSRMVVERNGDAFRMSERRLALRGYLALRSSVVRSSLFAAADAGGIPESVAMQLADIFGGDIDFYRDLRSGDRFSVVYEMLLIDGRPARPGRVIGAEFVNQGRHFRAVYYAAPGADGRPASTGYYAPDGTNLRKAFLRSPLEFSRVTSGFGMRKHPLFRNWRAHKGVDYGAPVGTRVRATGDGFVEFVGVKGGYGRTIVLRHAGRYSTVYAHLSAFAAGLRRGARVAQGDIIGYTGQSGLATGPHLHYEFRVAGDARNPLSIALPAVHPLPAQELAAFRRQAEPVLSQLDLLADTNLALLE